MHDEHDWIRSVYNIGLEGYSSQDCHYAIQAFEGFLRWVENWKVEPLYVEKNMVSEKHQYGGTPDLIAEVNGKVALVDWKTSKERLYPTIFIQLAAYDNLCVEILSSDIEEYHVLRIPKNQEKPSFSHSYWSELPKEAWQSVRALLNLQKAETRLKELL